MVAKLVAVAALLAALGAASAAVPALSFLGVPELVSHEWTATRTPDDAVESRITLHIRNPNFFPIHVERAEAVVHLDGRRILDAETEEPVALTPHATTALAIVGEADAREMERILEEGDGPVPVQASGHIRIGWGLGGIDLPFDVEHDIDRATLSSTLEACRQDPECSAQLNAV